MNKSPDVEIIAMYDNEGKDTSVAIIVQCYPPPANAFYSRPSFAIAMDKNTLPGVTIFQVLRLSVFL